MAGNELAGAILQLATAGVALYGAVRCVRLQRFGSDSRLKALAAFFALFAAGMALQATWQVQVVAGLPDLPASAPPPTPPFDHGLFHPEGSERVNILLAAAQVLQLASLVVAVWAFGHRRAAAGPGTATAALAPFAFSALGAILPLALALEAGLALYLAARALINHVERRSAGALQVALGFLLFFLSHLVVYLGHQPGMGRTGVGDVLALVGVVLLVQVLPPRR